MIRFTKTNHDAHRVAQDESANSQNSCIYIYPAMSGFAYAVCYGAQNLDAEIMPKDATRIWEYENRIPTDVRAHALKSNNA